MTRQQQQLNKFDMKTGETHCLFGVRALKFHNARDQRWTASEKVTQYVELTNLHEKDRDLYILGQTGQQKQQTKKLKLLRKQVKDCIGKLHNARCGNGQQVKNLLQNDIALQRAYHNLPFHIVVDKIFHQKCLKRKELDRLNYQKNQLFKSYEMTLLDVSKRQDRIMYADSYELVDSKLTKKLLVDLNNSETRKQAIRGIKSAYTQILHNMMHDSLYFDSLLTDLNEDVVEQDLFIRKTVLLGLPAMKKVEELTTVADLLEVKTQQNVQNRMKDIVAYRDQIARNDDRVLKLVRADSDFKIFPNRYNRETVSMLTLKDQLKETGDIMKLLKNATSCLKSEQVFPRMKLQVRDNKRLENNLIRREHERYVLQLKNAHAIELRKLHEHNSTDEKIRHSLKILTLREEIAREQCERNRFISLKEQRGEILCTLRVALQHISEVLQHVGDQEQKQELAQNSTTELSLLNFGAFIEKTKQLPRIKTNSNILIQLIKNKIKILMSRYAVETSNNILQHADNEYHAAVVNEIQRTVAEGFHRKPSDSSKIEISGMIAAADPNVPDRNTVKARSQRIVEINAKKDD